MKKICSTQLFRIFLYILGCYATSNAWTFESTRKSVRQTHNGLGHHVTLHAQSEVLEREDTMPTLMLFNSKSREKELLATQEPGKVSMYTCGPTVYDFAHIGNFRAFLTYDIVKRVLKYFGYDVSHVCNLTDVDDKIIQRANEQNLKSTLELTRKFEDLFMEDLRALNIVPANYYPRATEHVPEMIDMILTLRDNGFAYETEDGSWYFRTTAKEGYGQQLVNFNTDEDWAAEDAGDAPETGEKEHFQDFCLWKAFKPGIDREDLAWTSDCGTIKKGRPGWHLECSAMARKYFGDGTIDLHGGGVDLKFPHHENEIAQSEGCTGNTFCNCWFHNGFVNINDEKMSKSLGNFLTLRTACPNPDDVRAYRYLVVSSQYRNALNFSDEATKGAKNSLKRIDKAKAKLDEAIAAGDKSSQTCTDDSPLATETVPRAIENFEAALKDDINMPRAAAAMFGLIKAAETEFKRFAKAEDELDIVGLEAIRGALLKMDEVFGIFYVVPLNEKQAAASENDDGSVPCDVMELVMQRTAAKEGKDFELADSLRARITELGFVVKDVKGGDPVVSRVE